MPDPTRSTVVATDGVRLAVREHGDRSRPTVVLVHGYPDTQELWSGVASDLAADHHVVTYDVRGAGDSDRPAGVAGYALTQLSDDLLAVIEAVAPDGRGVHLAGHDWGAIQSWESAARPQVARRLRSFTAVAGPSLDLAAHASRSAPLGDRLRQLRKSWYVVGFHLPFVPVLWRRVLGDRWPRIFASSEGVRPPAGHPAPTFPDDAADGVGLYRRNMLDRLMRPRYSRVEVPLVQVGITERDAFIDPAIYDDLPGRMPELWVRRADATHWVPLLQPALVAGWIRDAVSGAERGEAAPADAAVHRG